QQSNGNPIGSNPQASTLAVLIESGRLFDSLSTVQVIGQGSYGSVHLTVRNANPGSSTDENYCYNPCPQMFAVKHIVLPQLMTICGMQSEDEAAQAVLEEVNLTQKLRHKNIVEVLGCYRKERISHIVMRFCPGGSLSRLLEHVGSLSEKTAKVYTADILRGVAYLHSKQVVHRDIKGANTLIDSTGALRLADFGSSRKLQTKDTRLTSVRGTPHWMAPEVIRQTGHAKPADLWSVGCTVIEMLTGSPPFSGFTSPHAAMYAIASQEEPLVLPANISANCKAMLRGCLEREEGARMTAAQALGCSWLASKSPSKRHIEVIKSAAQHVLGSAGAADRTSSSSAGAPRNATPEAEPDCQQQQQQQQVGQPDSAVCGEKPAPEQPSDCGSTDSSGSSSGRDAAASNDGDATTTTNSTPAHSADGAVKVGEADGGSGVVAAAKCAAPASSTWAAPSFLERELEKEREREKENVGPSDEQIAAYIQKTSNFFRSAARDVLRDLRLKQLRAAREARQQAFSHTHTPGGNLTRKPSSGRMAAFGAPVAAVGTSTRSEGHGYRATTSGSCGARKGNGGGGGGFVGAASRGCGERAAYVNAGYSVAVAGRQREPVPADSQHGQHQPHNSQQSDGFRLLERSVSASSPLRRAGSPLAAQRKKLAARHASPAAFTARAKPAAELPPTSPVQLLTSPPTHSRSSPAVPHKLRKAVPVLN
ncbi:Mitogen-activated protein kinase kinase kinase 2, partial [Diplonema papillatum]